MKIKTNIFSKILFIGNHQKFKVCEALGYFSRIPIVLRIFGPTQEYFRKTFYFMLFFLTPSQNKKTKMLGPFYFLTKNLENDLLFVYHIGGKTTSVQEDYSEHTMVGSGNSGDPRFDFYTFHQFRSIFL